MPSRTDEMLSKGMEKAKEVKAWFTGLSGVFKTLAEQHGAVSALMNRAKAGSSDKRGELWPQIRNELLSHERGELKVVFPELRNFDATRAFAEDHDREAGELEQTIRMIDNVGIASEEGDKLFDQLVSLVKQHVSKEEGEIFPKSQEVLGEDRTNSLEARYLQAQQEAKQVA